MKCKYCEGDLIELGDRLYCIPCGIGIWHKKIQKLSELIPIHEQKLKFISKRLNDNPPSYGIGADKCNGIKKVYLGGSCIPK